MGDYENALQWYCQAEILEFECWHWKFHIESCLKVSIKKTSICPTFNLITEYLGLTIQGSMQQGDCPRGRVLSVRPGPQGQPPDSAPVLERAIFSIPIVIPL